MQIGAENAIVLRLDAPEIDAHAGHPAKAIGEKGDGRMQRVIDDRRRKGALQKVAGRFEEESNRRADVGIVLFETFEFETGVGAAAFGGRHWTWREGANVTAVRRDGFAMFGQTSSAREGGAKGNFVGNEKPVIRQHECDAAFVAG